MNKKQLNIPKRGEIWLVEFPKNKENRKPQRPCLIVSSDIQNEYGKWIVVVGITTKDVENIAPFEVFIENTPETGLDQPSKLKLNYPRTIDRERLKKHFGVIDREVMEKAKTAWKIAFAVEEW